MRPLIAHLDLNALSHNIACLRVIAPKSKLCAVVKANAYGHRLTHLLDTLSLVDYLAVSCLEEAQEIRALGSKLPILLLEGVFDANEYIQCADDGFAVVISHEKQCLDLLTAHLSRPLDVWIKVDTGMHRLGIKPELLDAYMKKLELSPNVDKIHIMSHFACADKEDNSEFTDKQIQIFNDASSSFKNNPKSLCNSAGILSYKHVHTDMIRAGLILYGISPFATKSVQDLGFMPVLSLTTKIIQIIQIKKGEYIGYGAAYQAAKDMTIAVIACGYADGYPREISADAYVLVGDIKAAIVGVVAMDMLSIDVSTCTANIGDDVVLWGQSGKHILSIETVSMWANTIPYTIITHLANRIHFKERRY